MIQPFEVVKYSSARSEYDTKWIEANIDAQVFMFFKSHISIDAYNCFMSKLIPVVNLLIWDSSNTYAVDTMVLYDNAIYKKIAAINPTDEVPFDNTDWEEPARFSDSWLQGLWVNSLRSILAETILQSSLVEATWQATSKGLIAFDSDNNGGRGVTSKEFTLAYDNKSANIFAKVELLKNYITINKDNIPCLEWRECECGNDKNPVHNEVGGTEDSTFYKRLKARIRKAEKNVIKELGKVLVVKKVSEEVGEKRLAICEQNKCGMFNADRQCMDCSCYMDTKAFSEEHFDIRKGKVVITHCPKAMWDEKLDKYLIDYYNSIS